MGAGRLGGDARQEPALGIAGRAVGVDGKTKLVFVGDEEAVEGFTVGGVAFTADVKRNAGAGEQVPLVRGVDEHAGLDAVAIFEDEGADAIAVLRPPGAALL